MNILLINHYAGGLKYGMEYRPFYMAREWIKMGHSVTIIGADFSHLRKKQPEAGEEIIDGIRFIWLKSLKYEGNGIKRVCNIFKFVLDLYFCNFKNINPDLVIASSTYPLDIYPAQYIAQKYNAKLVYEVHDLWPLSPMELAGMSKYHPFIVLLQMAENYAYKKVDKVISMLPRAEQHMLEHGLAHNKFEYVPNGIDIEEAIKSQNTNIKEDFVLELKAKGNFIVGYTGGHAISNALSFLIKAASKLKDEKISFVLIGSGNEKSKLIDIVIKKQLSNVFFLDQIEKKEIYNMLKNFDVLYIGWQKKSLYRFGVCPNKLFDYMMAGKPIIHSITAGNDLVAEANCGISVPAEDEDAIAKAILRMKSLSKDEKEVLGLNGKKYVMEHHDYKILAGKFLKLIEF